MKKVTEIKRKKLLGIVTKLSSTNTIKIETESKSTHPKYKKVITSNKGYLVHCMDKEVKVGDHVMVEEGKPISRTICFYFVKKI